MLFRVTLAMDNGLRFRQFVKCDTKATARVFASSGASRLGWTVSNVSADTDGICTLPLSRDLGHYVAGTDWIPA